VANRANERAKASQRAKTAALAAALLGAACGGGGGDEPCIPSDGCVPPIEATLPDPQAMNGSWSGLFEDDFGDIRRVDLVVSAGTITMLELDGSAIDLGGGAPLVPADPRLFRFTIPPNRRGMLLVDEAVQHASYALSDLSFGVIERVEPDEDPRDELEIVGTWVGAGARIDENFVVFESAGGVASCDVALACTFGGPGLDTNATLALDDFSELFWLDEAGQAVVSAFVSSDGVFAGALIQPIVGNTDSFFGAWTLEPPAP